jgi:hypothetical protein
MARYHPPSSGQRRPSIVRRAVARTSRIVATCEPPILSGFEARARPSLLGGRRAGESTFPTINVKVVIAPIPNGIAPPYRAERPHDPELAPRAFPLPIGDFRLTSDSPTMPGVPEGQILFVPAALTSVSYPGHSPHPDASGLVKRERVPSRRSGRGVPGCHRSCSGLPSYHYSRFFLWVPLGGGLWCAEAPTLLGGRGFDTRRHERGSRVGASASRPKRARGPSRRLGAPTG